MFVKYRVIFILIILNTQIMFADDGDISTPFKYKNLSSLFFLSVGIAFGSASPSFFNDYNKLFVTNTDDNTTNPNTNKDFKTTSDINIGLKFQFLPNYRFGILIDYVKAYLTDGINQTYKSFGYDQSRYLGENISVSSIPILITAEYIPFDTQFRIYYGIGLGVVVSSTDWDEFVSSTNEYEQRTGGQLVLKNTIYPSFRIYAGTELGFDKTSKSAFLGSFIIEAGYTFYGRYINMFSELANQFDPKLSNSGTSYTVFPGYIGLNFGITFNVQNM
jgi:outer membrane protease